MNFSIHRLTSPVLDRIPDISHQPKRRQVSIGIVASIVFHLLLLLFALGVGKIMPDRKIIPFAKPKPKLQEIEVTVIPPTPKALSTARLVTEEEIAHPTPFIDSRGLNPSQKEPGRPLFESDINMIAASEGPALGAAPLPSQEGRTDRNFPQFMDARVQLAVKAPTAPPLTAPAPPKPAAPSPPPPTPTAAQAAPQAAAAPTPPPRVADAPKPPLSTPMPEVAKPTDAQLALLSRPAATPPPPAPEAPPAPRLQMRANVGMRRPAEPAVATPPPAAAPPAPAPSSYHPEQEKTRVEGNITNRGKSAVDAIGTPMGRYKKAVIDSVGSRWYIYTESKTDLIAPGSAMISWSVDKQGRVGSVRVDENTSNGAFAEICARALLDTKLPPPPAGLFDPLPGGKLDFAITFTFYTH